VAGLHLTVGVPGAVDGGAEQEAPAADPPPEAPPFGAGPET